MTWRGVLAIVLIVLSYSGDAQDQRYGILQRPRDGAVISNLECKKQMDLLHDHLDKQIPWAYKMLDSSSKINYGILTGNVMDFGNFDECMALYHNDEETGIEIRPKYCTYSLMLLFPNPIKGDPMERRNLPYSKEVEIFAPRMNRSSTIQEDYITLALSLCIPSACKPSEIEAYITPAYDLKEFNDDMCQTPETGKEIDASDIIAIVILSIIILCVILSTTYDYYLLRTKKESPHLILLAFSVLTNARKVLKTTKNPDQLMCLNGLRSISIMWVMAGHRYSIQPYMPQINKNHIAVWMNQPSSQYILGAPIAVDTFLFISGCLMAYGFIRSQSKPNARFNVFMYYLHRYLRITPALAIVYLVHVSIIRHLSDGPMYPEIFNTIRDNCLEYWWTTFLYVQNYVNMDKICLLHTWYLSMDMHMFLASPIVLIPLVKYTKQMIYVLSGLLLISIICPFLIVYLYEIKMYETNYYDYYYYVTHTRLAPWLIGLLCGAIISIYKDKPFRINWTTNVFVWTVVLFGMINIIYWGNDVANNYNIWSTSFYLSFHRAAWAVGLSWITFACLKGYGGFINWFLCQPFFQIIARLSFCMYLVHFSVLAVSLARIRTPSVFLDYEMLYSCFADVVVTVVVGFVWVLLFESPLVVLEKIIFFGAGRKPKAPKPDEELGVKKLSKVGAIIETMRVSLTKSKDPETPAIDVVVTDIKRED